MLQFSVVAYCMYGKHQIWRRFSLNLETSSWSTDQGCERSICFEQTFLCLIRAVSCLQMLFCAQFTPLMFLHAFGCVFLGFGSCHNRACGRCWGALWRCYPNAANTDHQPRGTGKGQLSHLKVDTVHIAYSLVESVQCVIDTQKMTYKEIIQCSTNFQIETIIQMV